MMSLVHVDDVANAYRLAAEQNPAGETFLIVDDKPCTMREFANHAASQLGRPSVKSMPMWLSRLAAGSVVVETLTTNCKVRNTKAKEGLGWKLKYPTYAEGIPATLQALGQETGLRKAHA